MTRPSNPLGTRMMPSLMLPCLVCASLTVCLLCPSQSILKGSGGGRQCKHGEPNWRKVYELVHDDDFEWPSDWKKSEPEILAAMNTHISDGGGLTSAGPKAGVYSEKSATVTFLLKCKSVGCYKCPFKVKLIQRLIEHKSEVYIGWEHDHNIDNFTGDRGLPPQLKHAVITIINKHPRITVSAVSNEVFESQKFDRKFQKKVATLVYNERQRRNLVQGNDLGISSFGTVAQKTAAMAMNPVLSESGATTNTVFNIGVHLDPEANEVIVIFSAIKGLMFLYEHANSGYGTGMVMLDFTYKVFKEKLVMVVGMVPDIAQHGKLAFFGPCSHETHVTTETIGNYVRTHLNKLLLHISTDTLPEEWSPSLRVSIMQQYGNAVKQQPRADFGGVLSDMALAIPNGLLKSSLINLAACDMMEEQRRACWAHVWRAIGKQIMSKLVDKSDDNKSELYDDLSTYHELRLKNLKVGLGIMLVAKWSTAKKEPEVAQYLKEEYLEKHNFSRCDGMPGQPTDTNMLERKNLDLKGPNYFNSVEGAGTVIAQTPLLGERAFSNTLPMQFVPDVSLKLWKKAQRLLERGWSVLGTKYKDGTYVYPSEFMLENNMPKECDTVTKKRNHLQVWLTEFRELTKKGDKYMKMNNGDWDFDVAADMIMSFWQLKAVPKVHKHCEELKEVGICYICDCPQFNHYYACKHSIALGLHFGEIKVPTKCSVKTVGKRKAPGGASLRKRSRALEVDN